MEIRLEKLVLSLSRMEAQLLLYAIHDLRDSQFDKREKGAAYLERYHLLKKMGEQLMDANIL